MGHGVQSVTTFGPSRMQEQPAGEQTTSCMGIIDVVDKVATRNSELSEMTPCSEACAQ